MNVVLISLILIFTIKCEGWWSEIKGHNIGDYDFGYAGSYPREDNDFYLCSERKYRVHYFGDDDKTWSEEFSACQPAGKCRLIDGLAISGGKPYACRIEDTWPNEFTWGYDIYNSSGGYAGKIGRTVRCVLIYGNEIYRVSDNHENYLCSYEQAVANRIVYNLFGNNLTYNYENETQIEIKRNKNINVTVQLLKRNNINLKGKITIKIEKSLITKNNYKDLITKNYINIISNIIGFDFNNLKTFFEEQFKEGMSHGDIAINFDWIEKRIIIEVGSKITFAHYGYRGGFRINIYLNEQDLELLQKIKNIFKFFLRYLGKRITPELRDILSNFQSFKNVNSLINYLNNPSHIVEEVILFTIFEEILVLNK